jgi:hypothetical protein
MRQKWNEEHHSTELKAGSKSPFETAFQGVGAEIAFCKLFNLYPDLETGVHGKFDVLSRSGAYIDVKTTEYPTGHLAVHRFKVNKKADLYVLLVGVFPTYRCAGAMSAAELIREERLWSLKADGTDPSYNARQDELFPLF